MIKSRKFIVLMLVVSMLALLIGCSAPTPTTTETPATPESAKVDAEETFLIRAGIGLNDQHPQFKGLEIFKEYVNGATIIDLTKAYFLSEKSIRRIIKEEKLLNL